MNSIHILKYRIFRYVLFLNYLLKNIKGVYDYLYQLGLKDKFSSYNKFCRNAHVIVKNVYKGSSIKLFLVCLTLPL